MKPALCTYTHLAFLINWVIDDGRGGELKFEEIHEAAQEGRLIELLAERYGHIADFSLVRGRDVTAEMEVALRDGAAALEGRERRAGVRYSGRCLVMGIVLEAIQQQFHRFPEVPEEVEEVISDQ